MSRVRGSLTIARPVAEVFDAVADQCNEPRFNPRMTRCVMVRESPIGAGSTVEATMRGRRQPVPVTVEYTRFQRPHLIASRSRMPGALVEGQLRCEPIGHGTRLSWDWVITTTGMTRLARPLITVLGRRQERAIWSGLKHLLEDGTDEHRTTDSVDPRGRVMNATTPDARTAGILLLVATAASIIDRSLIAPLRDRTDCPVIRRYAAGLAIGSVAFRVIERTLYLGGALGALLIVALAHADPTGADGSTSMVTGQVLLSLRDRAREIGVLACYIGGSLSYAAFLRHRLLPRRLALWGLVGISPPLTPAVRRPTPTHLVTH